MKTLLILRHAKASSDLPVSDFDRPLNDRGDRDAPRMGELLRRERLVPELIVASPAVRASRTAEHVAGNCGYRGPLTLRQELYLAESDALLEIVRGFPEPCERVLMVAHNPALEGLVTLLTGQPVKLSPAGMARVDLKIDRWAALRPEQHGTLTDLWGPQDV